MNIKYFSKIVIAQILNVAFPFAFVYLVLRESNTSTFAELEGILVLGYFGYLFVEFSFKVISPTIFKARKLTNERLSGFMSNLVVVRVLVAIVANLIVIGLVYFVNISNVSNYAFIHLFITAAIIDVSWLYLLKDRFHVVIIAALFKNATFLLSLLLLDQEVMIDYYIPILALIAVLQNFILMRVNSLFISLGRINWKKIVFLYKKSWRASVSDLSIAVYTYLDVYIAILLLPLVESGVYIFIRKMVKGLNGIIGQLPKIFLRTKYYKNTNNINNSSAGRYLYLGMAISFFVCFLLFYEYVAITVFNLSDPSNIMHIVAMIASITLLIGPLQNYILQYNLLPESPHFYLVSYLIGSSFFYIVIFLLYYEESLSTYNFMLTRVLVDVVILLTAVFFISRLNTNSQFRLRK